MFSCFSFVSLRGAPNANTAGDGPRPTQQVSDEQKCRHFVWINADTAKTSEYTELRYRPGDLLNANSRFHLQTIAECSLAEDGDGVEEDKTIAGCALAECHDGAADDADTGRHFLRSPSSRAALALALATEIKTRNQKEVQAYTMCTQRKDCSKAYPICTQRIPTQSTCDELPELAEGTEEDDSDVESIDGDTDDWQSTCEEFSKLAEGMKEDDADEESIDDDTDDWQSTCDELPELAERTEEDDSDVESIDDDKDDGLQGFPEWFESFPEREEESATHRGDDDRTAGTTQFHAKINFPQADWPGEVSSLPVPMRVKIFELKQLSARKSVQLPACLEMPQVLQKATMMQKCRTMAETLEHSSPRDDIAIAD